MQIAHIVLPVHVTTFFDYQVPVGMTLNSGVRVKIPFGKRHVIGIVDSIDDTSHIDISKLKMIEQVLDEQSLFSPVMWRILHWAADYYHFPLGEVLFHALPILLRHGKSAIAKNINLWVATEQGKQQDLNQLKRAIKQQQILAYLKEKPLQQQDIKSLDFNLTTLKELQKKQLVECIPYVVTDNHDPLAILSLNSSPFQLTQEQQTAIEQVIESRDHFNVWLLDGVTGSGKTEVYLQVLAQCLQEGKQALVLVPEISLTPQTIKRFKQRFNAPIDVLHSAMNESERLAVWIRAKNGHNAIIIGTRSAVFSPFKQLGVIIVDEEHDGSYKQQDGWLYQARDLAVLRAKEENIPVILGSATPSLESLYNVKNKKYRYLTLTQRAGNAQFAKQLLIDLKGRKLILGLAPPFIEEMKQHLQANNQVMLFINRRGYAPVLMCHDCGWTAQCERCDSYFTLHRNTHKLCCHRCDSQKIQPKQCPKCHSEKLISVGVGTEQLEIELPRYFPNIPITRIDRDTTLKKGALDSYLQEIQQGGARILIGTQILAKGHHFPDVTLVGVIDVDGALFSTDFRATERFAQLYTQVAGRAGRAEKEGCVILQTHHPQHPLLQTLITKGYNEFSAQILAERQSVLLPPFSHHVMIKAQDFHSENASQFLYQIKEYFLDQGDDSLWVLGPVPAIHAKRAGKYRWQLIIQHTNRRYLQQIVTQLVHQLPQFSLANKVRWAVDVDPTES